MLHPGQGEIERGLPQQQASFSQLTAEGGWGGVGGTGIMFCIFAARLSLQTKRSAEPPPSQGLYGHTIDAMHDIEYLVYHNHRPPLRPTER